MIQKSVLNIYIYRILLHQKNVAVLLPPTHTYTPFPTYNAHVEIFYVN